MNNRAQAAPRKGAAVRYVPLLYCAVVVLVLPTAAVAADAGEAAGKISFKRIRLDDKFRSEGVAIGDFNRDGKPDVAAGTVLYLAPDFQPVGLEKELPEYNPRGAYSRSFQTFAEDLDGDGWTDVIVVTFPGDKTIWWQNPGEQGGAWKPHVAVPVTNNESPQMVDLTGDGKRELVFAAGDRMAFARPGADPYQPWPIRYISQPKAPGTERYSHGLGIGDINGDGRRDVLVTAGWWEAPEDRTQTPWKFHAANFGPACAQMYAFDFDGDGDADVLSSSAHNFGIWWHEQTAEGWTTHTIDQSFSQTHGLCLADIDGDGLPDFVTGKRWFAHNGNDPGAHQPAVFKWFRLSRRDGKPVWTAYQFDDDSGPGTQFEVGDLNGDGLLDVASANKKGVHLFLQVRP